MKKKRIIFFMDTMTGGGAERTVVDVLTHLDRKEFEPMLALLRPYGEYMEQIPSDVQTIYFSQNGSRVRSGFNRLWQIKSLVDTYQPDIITAGLDTPNCSLLRAAPLIQRKCRLLITQQNNLTLRLRHSSNKISSFLKSMEIRLLFPLADHVIAVSHGIKSELIQNYGVNKARVTVIHNPVDVMKVQEAAKRQIVLPWKDQEQAKLIIAVGRLVPQKGFTDLLNIFAKIRKQLNCRLIILGQGPLRASLELQIQTLNLGDDVHMPGFVDNPWAYMRTADLFVSTSYWEGLPLTLLEVMAVGTPIISTDCDFGPREVIVNGENGVLTAVGNIELMTKQILDLLQNDAKCIALRNEGQKRALDFDSSLITKNYQQLFTEVAGS